MLSDDARVIFFAMSPMRMPLWTLSGLGGPLATDPIIKVVLNAVFTLLVVVRPVGPDDLSAELSAGFALGATPTAIANMSTVTKRYGATPLAFISLHLASAFFVELAYAVVIRFFVGL